MSHDYGILQGLCIGKISGFPGVSGLQLQTRLLRLLRPPCFFVLICWVAALRWQPITSVEVKFVARQVEASVVIRATKLKFVAESRVYFSQHVASTCNIVFCCETSWRGMQVVIRATESFNLHCNNVARQVGDFIFILLAEEQQTNKHANNFINCMSCHISTPGKRNQWHIH